MVKAKLPGLYHFPPLPQAKQPQPHLQRIHHTIGQHSHLPSHRLDALLKLGNVSCGEHIAQGYTTCKSKGKGGSEPCSKPCPGPALLTGSTGCAPYHWCPTYSMSPIHVPEEVRRADGTTARELLESRPGFMLR